MPLLDALNRFFDLLLDGLRLTRRLGAWGVLLLYYLVYALILWAHVDFTAAPFYSLIRWWISLPIFPDAAARATAFTHYPNHFVLLVDYYGWAKLAVGTVFEGLILGLVARRLAGRAAITGQAAGLVSRWPHLVVGWALVNWLMVAAALYLPRLFAPMLAGPRRVLAFNLTVIPFVYTLVVALFFVVIVLVAVRGMGVLPAIGMSLRSFLQRPFSTLTLAAVVVSGPYLFALMAGYAGFIVQRFHPEMVVWVLALGLVAEMIAAFLWMAFSLRLSEETV